MIFDEMHHALQRAAIWFRGYEASHRAKGTHDSNIKAQTNADRAAELEALCARYEGSLPPKHLAGCPLPAIHAEGVEATLASRAEREKMP